ncbi:MAG: 1-deoxy-D-xylulose-5-phosphate synthase [Candidatus Omnitrophica bacterium]|jgi:transketolase|nr:1-deoxy-D-xylulose-5-phosphate synthase [Candidatus Omnitrophota bacterium]
MSLADMDIRDAFFQEIYNIAMKDKDVIFITADADSFVLRDYKKDFPDQFINASVAEQNMIAVAAGLALSGKKVFILALIPFVTLRCLEHIKVNICSMNLPVTIIGLGAGFGSGIDGPTHHAVDDIAIMRILPEITILNPSDSTLSASCAQIAYQSNSPVYVRLDKGKFPNLYEKDYDYSTGFKIIKPLKEVNIISTGFITKEAVKLAETLEKNNLSVGLIDLYKLKPLNREALLKCFEGAKYLITIEENSIVGGIGTIISELISDNRKAITLKRIALEDKQCFDYGTREWLDQLYGLDQETVSKIVLKELRKCQK